MAEDPKASVEFKIPDQIKEFIFNLSDFTTRVHNPEIVQKLYDEGLQEITQRFFSASPWPDAQVVAPECDDNEMKEIFLIFYK